MKIEYSVRVDTEADRRYRMMVILGRTDKPTHFKFHCPKCTMPVAELINSEVKGMSDIMTLENTSIALTGVRCDGRFQGSRCNLWFYFSLGKN